MFGFGTSNTWPTTEGGPPMTALSAIMSQYKFAFSVSVKRIQPQIWNGKQIHGHVMTCNHHIDEAYIKDRFGGGVYEITITDSISPITRIIKIPGNPDTTLQMIPAQESPPIVKDTKSKNNVIDEVIDTYKTLRKKTTSSTPPKPPKQNSPTRIDLVKATMSSRDDEEINYDDITVD